MKIVRGTNISIDDISNAGPILFCMGGTYFYVESGIVDNELRVLAHGRAAARPVLAGHLWLITCHQGIEIPQELGDYLVAQQGKDQTANQTGLANEKPED